MLRGGAGLLLVLAGLLCAAGARAATATDLYAAATPVADQSDSARDAAFSRDLAAVFVKLSGNPRAAQSAALSSMIADADKWVLEFRYQARAGAPGGLELWAHFDEQALNAALARSGLGVWGSERPRVLVWILTPAGIVGAAASNPVAAAVVAGGEARGLPVVLPKLDAADRGQVSDSDIRTLDLASLQASARRYQAQALLVGTIRGSDQGVAGSWNLAFGGSTTPFSATAATPQAAARAAVEHAATLLSRQLAYVPQQGSGGTLSVTVSGVASLAAEAAVARLLANVPGVSDAHLASIDADRADFSLRYAGAPSELARALSLSGTLTPEQMAPSAPASGTSAASSGTLYFRYTP